MGNLAIGTDVVAVKDAVEQVQKNIRELRERKSQVTIRGESATKIIQLYNQKIANQKVLLLWLRRSL